MGYSGQVYNISCADIGFNASPNFDSVPPNSMISPSKNVELHEGGIGKRGGSAHVNSTVISGTPDITGLYDFRLISGTQIIMGGTGGGKILSAITGTPTELKTGLASDSFYNFITYNNKVYITVYKSITASVPQKWDGAAGSTSDVGAGATLPTDWASNAFPKQLIVHGYGNSERVWAFGTPGKQNWIYITPNNDGASDADFSQATIITLYIETGDGFGLVGGVEFQDRLIGFGKRKAFVIDDADPNTDMWGYAEAAWEGGAATHRLIVKTPNDLICMMEDGEIYSVSAAQEYGDYKLGSISRPHFLHKWIKDNVDLTKIEQFHGTYDRKLRAVRFWVIRSNKTTCDTQLVYYIDRGKWSIEDNQSYASGCSAACSAEVRAAVGDYNIYTGDYDGFIWKLNQATKSDNGNGYWAGFKTPHLSFEGGDETGLSRVEKFFRSGRFIGVPKGDYNINITAIIDGGDSTSETVSLVGTGATLGSFVLGTDVLGGNEVLDKDFPIGLSGKRLALEFSNSTAGQDFFISALSVDFKPLGAKE